jgi:beta-galactosidase
MRKLILSLALAAAFLPLSAKPALEPWQDPNVFEENRMPMRATFVTAEQQTMSLNGLWKFHFNPTIEGRLKGFEAVGYDDAGWDEIPVPGLWDLQGYCDPMYVNIGYPWRGHYQNNPPYPALEHNYVGQYRRTFTVDRSWIGKQICLMIGSATSNVRVWVNGKMVGYSEDSKLEARFDLTKFVKAGENTIALEIFRWCDGTYLEDQDFWRFSGIARGVEVYTREKERLEDVHVTGWADGSLKVALEVTKGITAVDLEVLDANGRKVLSETGLKPTKGKVDYTGSVRNPSLWSAEVPNLYTLKVKASTKKGAAESTCVDFGFRTVEIVGNQLKVNGQPILIKGVDRHELSATGGYVVTEAEMIRDIRIMKELNVNAVRTCHYPDDPRWLALCDKYGLYVVDEGNIESHGMGYGPETLGRNPLFAAAHLARDSRMVQRDFNHPAVIVWSMGNEAGDGPNFEACYDWIKAYDPSRPVQYERALQYEHHTSHRYTDVYCPMYYSPDQVKAYLKVGTKPFIQCEYAHAMGNSMGNFKEYWDIARAEPGCQGGFIWDFQDQALRWPSDAPGTDHIYIFGGDLNDYDPSDGSFNCNGVIAADRTLHPHAYEVRYQYRNILTAAGSRPGVVKVTNEYFFNDLSAYRLAWSLEADGEVVRTGVTEQLDVAPQQTKAFVLGIGELPAGQVVTLNVNYQQKAADGLLPAGHVVAYDQLILRDEPSLPMGTGAPVEGKVKAEESASAYTFSGTVSRKGTLGTIPAQWSVTIDKSAGALSSYKVDGKEMLAGLMVPCFDRALNENDLGARFQEHFAFWRNLSFKVASVAMKQVGNNCQVDVVYAPIGGKARVKVAYVVDPEGKVGVSEAMEDAGGLADAPHLFRFGMRFAMPGAYSDLDFFGLGPWENYSDRHSAALLGHYRQRVEDQYHYGYVRSQESGTHTDIRWMRLLDAAGNGLEFTAPTPFSASALPFSLEDLDAHVHSLELKAKACEGNRSRGKTYVHIDLVQMGVGGIDSWMSWPLKEYLLPAKEREFVFVLKPVHGIVE